MSFRVVHYINQFYGGIGGEDKAGTPLIVRDGPIGPGRLLEAAFEGQAQITKTLICGDNAIHEHPEILHEIIRAVREIAPDIVIAGPAFASGRYGLACVMIASMIESEIGIPTLCGMHSENPAAHPDERPLYIIETGASSGDMKNAIGRMAHLAVKLACWEPLGSAAEEGYLPRGVRKNMRADRGAHTRAIDAVLATATGHPTQSEISLETYDFVPPAEPIGDLSTAKIAVVTEAGLVPLGNPDRIEAARATRWASYSIERMQTLQAGQYESVHGGYDNTWVNGDPNRAVPIDALRSLEAEGKIGQLFDAYFVTCGSVGNVTEMRRMGREIAEALKKQQIQGVIVPST
ncbi:MAG: glycine/betaine/sarcosine/D-proline family reductase selenoprotein B [Vulcanimicrobiaceae bacterium]